MSDIAVILVAGMGKRLMPFTASAPKCMISGPDGIPLLHTALHLLVKEGIDEVLLGVGYRKEAITLPEDCPLKVRFIENERWQTTNNIETLRLVSREAIQRDFENVYIIEGDVFLGPRVIKGLATEQGSAAAVLPASFFKRGSCVAIDEGGFVRSLRDNRMWHDQSAFKLANVYKLSRKDFLSVSERLSCRPTGDYYEAVIGELIGRVRIKAVLDGDCREIDNGYDLYSLLDSHKLDYETVRSNWGGLWRRSTRDHFFLSNPYYPTEFIRERLRHYFDRLLDNYPSGRRRINTMLRANANVSSEFPMYAVNGASEAIRVIENYFTQKGILFKKLFSPTFGEYSRFPVGQEGEATGLIVVSPNNPTTEIISIAELKSYARQYEVIILDLSLWAAPDTEYLNAANALGNVVVIRSLSKVMGIPGIRLGYVASPDSLVPALEDMLPIWNINAFAEAFLELHLDCQSDYEESLRSWEAESMRVSERILEFPHVEQVSVSTGFVLVKTDRDLVDKLYQDYGIMVADMTRKFAGSVYHARIGIRTSAENDYLLMAMEALLS